MMIEVVWREYPCHVIHVYCFPYMYKVRSLAEPIYDGSVTIIIVL